MFEVQFGGAETTVQDLGRPGYYRYGICPSGAQDNFSFRVGNVLLKNRENSAALEITVVGPVLRARKETVVAFTGADMSPNINGEEVQMWMATRIRAGDMITFRRLRTGCRAYLSVAGGIDVPVIFGSRSTGTLSRIGGYKGRKLEKSDLLKALKPEFPLHKLEGIQLPKRYMPSFSKASVLRVTLGMYDYLLTKGSLVGFFKSKWKVASNSNRVGYYLEGPKFEFIQRKQPFGAGDHPSNVVDIQYPVGSIQVPGGQHAVLLLNDAVTGGGYATIGTVIKPDLDIVAQSKPGDFIIFKSVEISKALIIRKEKEERISKIKEVLNYPF